MGKRGPKPRCTVSTRWSTALAYAIGLITTDGSLSIDGRHINLTSKDKILLESFKNCLKIHNKIGRKNDGKKNVCYQVQFGDVNFYKFLQSLGLMPNKTKILKSIAIPDGYFFDFLRGHFDGDGTFYSYWDPRWRSSFMFYTVFLSVSLNHVKWLRGEIYKRLGIWSHMDESSSRVCYQLKYAKRESLVLLKKLYYHQKVIHLPRKLLKINKALSIINQQI